MKQIGAIIAPQADRAGLRYDIQLSEIKNPFIYGDALRISQILINILGNAVKFTPPGGTVRLSVEELPAQGDMHWARYRFTISDTGVGMAKDIQAHLFEPFVRSNAVSRVEGAGLGLSIVKGLVDLMEGEIEVQSAPGMGSTFLIELMCEISPADEGRDTPEPQPPGGIEEGLFAGRRFLIAEDNAINSEIICEILQMCGAETVVRSDGALAVEAFFSAAPGTYDAILMDIQMPEMDGYAAARTIRSNKRPDAKTIPIIAMTANAFVEDVEAALEAGMDAHIAKPLDIGILCSTLGKLRGK